MRPLAWLRPGPKHMLVLTVAASLVLSSALLGCTSSTAKGKALVAERCTRCHAQAQAESGQRTAEEWTNIVDTMIARGAQLDPTERQQVIDYLSSK